MTAKSQIFTGFRALGFTSNHIPLAVRYHKKHNENYVVTCVGKAFHTYNCSRLGIVSVSNSHPSDIQCIAVDARLVFTACGTEVYAYSRGRELCHTYKGHDSPVHLLLPFAQHLISVDEKSSVKIWHIKSEEEYLGLEFSNSSFQITAVLHPNTYLNKLLFGSKQGTLQLWNIRTSKLLFTFSGWNSAVTALEQAPAVDVVAVGLADGRILLHNLKYDDTVVQFSQDWGPVTTLSFRTDGRPVMVSGSTAGHIAVWNLEDKKLQSQIRNAHSGAITGMKCLPSEPVMVTSSPDNSIRVWIFDQPDGGGRLLRYRAGHSAPPTHIKHHGDLGHTILSAGLDSTLQSFSAVHDSENKSLGRASYNKAESKRAGLKADQFAMPPITHFDSESSRESDWDGIVACHRGEKLATTWNYQRSTMGTHKLCHKRFAHEGQYASATAQCCAVSSCGNFAVIGYSSGHVDVYNLQSGMHRGTYVQEGSVRGVAIDGLNQVGVSGGADSKLHFWHFRTRKALGIVDMQAQVSQLHLHRESGMLAVVLDDFTVVIVDIETRRVVRNFTGHNNTVTDVTFSADGRWLLTAGMDCTVRTWDLPTGRLVDCFLVDAAVTSLSMSPTGDFLATAHVDDLGVYLWSNMSLYRHVALQPLPADFQPQVLQLPSTSIKSQGLRDDSEEQPEVTELTGFVSPEQLSDNLVTLSLLPSSRWHNLLHLDIIKQRNKPKQPPKVPKAAPFFLPTVPGLEPKFAAMEDDSAGKDLSHVTTSSLEALSEFGKLLQSAESAESYQKVFSRLKEMGPSTVDLELHSLGPEAGGSIQVMTHFLKCVQHVLSTNTDFELVQAYLALFLKIHSDTISREPVLVQQLKTLQQHHATTWLNVQDLFNQSMCLVNYLRSATL